MSIGGEIGENRTADLAGANVRARDVAFKRKANFGRVEGCGRTPTGELARKVPARVSGAPALLYTVLDVAASPRCAPEGTG